MSPDQVPSFRVRPQTPPLPHTPVLPQAALEHLLHFTLSSPLPTRNEAKDAKLIYRVIVDDCSKAGVTLLHPTGKVRQPPIAPDFPPPDSPLATPSNREVVDGADVDLARFFNALYDYSPTKSGRINLVRMILQGLFCPTETDVKSRTLEHILPLTRGWHAYTTAARGVVFATLASIACDLLQRFFAPLKAQGSSTAPVTAQLSPPGAASLGDLQGTPSRLSNLRQRVLLRDGHRCVISGIYETSFIVSERRAGRVPPASFGLSTEAAHIIPHSLNRLVTPSDELSPPKLFVWSILNMFDPGIAHALSGDLIDAPKNALLLQHDLHNEFGKLHLYLEPVEALPDSYIVRTTRGTALPPFLLPPGADTIVNLENHEAPGITCSQRPCRRLLKLHMACCRMLEMAAAAEYVENLLDNVDDVMIRGVLAPDGSSPLGMLLAMRGLQAEVTPELQVGGGGIVVS